MKTNPTFYFKEKNALVKDAILSKEIKTSTYSKEFTFSTWLNIDQYEYNRSKSKMIFCMTPSWSKEMMKSITEEDVKKNQRPGVWFEPLINNLRISMLTKDGNKKQLESCILYDIPVNEWFFLTITLSKRGLETYINGKLVRTVILSGDPIITQGNILVNYFGGFSGNIQKLQYSTKAFAPEEIQKSYNCGRQTSLLFNWFTVDRCPKIINPIAINEKCSVKSFGENLNQDAKMYFLDERDDKIACTKVYIDYFREVISTLYDKKEYEVVNNPDGDKGPTVGRDISCDKIKQMLENNELKLGIYENGFINGVYLIPKNGYNKDDEQHYTSGLNYKARSL